MNFPDTAFESLDCNTILPSQFFSRLGTREPLTGEHRLLLAVLEDAVNIYCNPRSTRRGLRAMREIEQWFASDDTSYVFAFERVCQALGLDCDYIRRGVREARQRRRVAVIRPEYTELLRAAS